MVSIKRTSTTHIPLEFFGSSVKRVAVFQLNQCLDTLIRKGIMYLKKFIDFIKPLAGEIAGICTARKNICKKK